MQGDERAGLGARMFGSEHQILDGLLVVQDPLRLQRILAFGRLAVLDQSFGVQTAVGVALQMG